MTVLHCYVVAGAFAMNTLRPEALWSKPVGDALWISKKNGEVPDELQTAIRLAMPG
jgi:hypothetical protein